MDKKYNIYMMYICPFIHLSGLNIVPDLKYPARLCVIDQENNFAIDIKTKLKYDYLKTVSRLYVGSMVDKIKDGRRVAIRGEFCLNDSIEEYKDGLKIIEKLELGEEFQNGNEVFNNEQYLEYLKQETIEEQNSTQKIKKIGKRKK